MSKAMPSGALLSLQNVLFEHPALHGTAVIMGRTHISSLLQEPWRSQKSLCAWGWLFNSWVSEKCAHCFSIGECYLCESHWFSRHSHCLFVFRLIYITWSLRQLRAGRSGQNCPVKPGPFFISFLQESPEKLS